MNKKKGFTLIELLAIIVILAIIAVITVPIILNIIEESKKGAAKDSAYGYKDSINKYYTQELLNNQNLKLNDTYTVTNGTLSGGSFGDSNVTSFPVQVSGTVPTSGSLTYSNNNLTEGWLVIGDYRVTFNQDGTVTIVKNSSNQIVNSLSIGDSVNYITSLNGVTLEDWSVFYVDGNYTYIILDDYLPNAALSSSFLTTYSLEKYGTYGIYGPNSSTDIFINAMTTKSNWDSLLTGTLNGHAINETSSENVWAIGSPTLELWVESWNDTYPNDTLYIRTDNKGGLNVYYVGDSPNPTDSYINLSSKTGYGNTLYFPHQESIDNGNFDGYWLSAASYFEGFVMEFARYNGYISATYIDTYDGSHFAFRPVIKLPTSILNQ